MKRAAALMIVLVTVNGGYSFAQTPNILNAAAPQYTVKPADVVLPQGVPLGQYRRIFQPFENWVLVCDENLQAKKKICNVSQTILNKATGATAFSWSLAAAEGGQPYMILRTPPNAKQDAGIELNFPGVKAPLKIRFDGCDQNVCLGKTQVKGTLMQNIGKGVDVTIRYTANTGEVISIPAPLRGLREAVASIK